MVKLGKVEEGLSSEFTVSEAKDYIFVNRDIPQKYQCIWVKDAVEEKSNGDIRVVTSEDINRTKVNNRDFNISIRNVLKRNFENDDKKKDEDFPEDTQEFINNNIGEYVTVLGYNYDSTEEFKTPSPYEYIIDLESADVDYSVLKP